MVSRDDNNDTTNTAKKETENRSHILIRRGKSLTNYRQLQDKHSIEAKIARGRGGLEVIEDESDDDETSNSVNVVLDEGKINAESGYFMHFVPPHHTHLSTYDIISIPDNTAYPLNEETMHSLPDWAKGQLHKKGHIQITASYDREQKKFKNIKRGWESEKNPYDKIVTLTNELDGDIVAAVYYLINNNASKDLAHPSTIAEARNIEENSVRKAIRKVERELSEK